MALKKDLEDALKGHMFDKMKALFDAQSFGGSMGGKLIDVTGDQYVVILNNAAAECFQAAVEFQKEAEDLV